jgi:hypothetical protein
MNSEITGWLGDKMASLVPAVLPSVVANATGCTYSPGHSFRSRYGVWVTCTLVTCPHSSYWSSCY